MQIRHTEEPGEKAEKWKKGIFVRLPSDDGIPEGRKKKTDSEKMDPVFDGCLLRNGCGDRRLFLRLGGSLRPGLHSDAAAYRDTGERRGTRREK
ncbi:unknown [Hungatella hathewayi CAG:224]|nr:unknown [Hungatella hathewayi CAG:224]